MQKIVIEFWVRRFEERESMSDNRAGMPSRFGDEEWLIAPPDMDAPRVLPDMRVAPDELAARAVIADAVRAILVALGQDPTREGLLRTPERVARAYQELLVGYDTDPIALLNGALFETEYHDMVVVKDIDFYSLCEHHILPFFGKAHVAYIPDGYVIGLSKIPRIVEMYARRLQLQENMTRQIADMMQELLRPRGVAVIVHGQHMCATMRGVSQSSSKMITQVMYGEFRDPEVRAQLNEHLRAGE